MTRLGVLLPNPELTQAALQTAAEQDIPAVELTSNWIDTGSCRSDQVVLVDATNLHRLPGGESEALLLLAIAPHDDLLDASHVSIAGLVRTHQLADDLADAWQLTRPEPAALGDAAVLSPYLVQLDSCHALPNERRLAFAAARALKRSLQLQAGAGTALSARCAAAVFEALENAMFHGNLELSSGLKQPATADAYAALLEQRQRQHPYRDRRVWVTTQIAPHAVHVTIRDEGQGFDASRWNTGPPFASEPPAGSAPPERRGRGWLVVQHFCSVVRYNEAGNEVTLTVPLAESLPAPKRPSPAEIVPSSRV